MNPDQLHQFITEDSITVEGITKEYLWYHAKILSSKMGQWDIDFQKMVKVMEDRHQEHLRMIETLLMQNKMLRSELKAKNEQVKDA